MHTPMINHSARRAPLSRVLAFAGGAALSLFLARPGTLSAQNLYVSEYGNNTILDFTPAGAFTVFSYGQVDGPTGLAFDPAGNLYVAGFGGNPNAIESFTPDKKLSLVTNSGLSNPGSLAFDTAGNLYVANYGNNTIAKIAPGGATSVFSSSALLHQPYGLAFDTAGNLFVANLGDGGTQGSIVKITPAGVVSVIADSTSVPSGTTGSGRFGGLAFDGAGNLYASDQPNNRILEFTPGGVVSTFATTGLVGPRGLAFDAAGNLYAVNSFGTTIEKFTPAGVGSVFASNLSAPQFLAFDNVSLPVRHPAFFTGEVALGQGVYYLAFPGNGNIIRVLLVPGRPALHLPLRPGLRVRLRRGGRQGRGVLLRLQERGVLLHVALPSRSRTCTTSACRRFCTTTRTRTIRNGTTPTACATSTTSRPARSSASR